MKFKIGDEVKAVECGTTGIISGITSFHDKETVYDVDTHFAKRLYFHESELVSLTKRYFLDQDHSCHWYIIAANKREEWNEWRSIDEDDERAWTVPDYAEEVGGGADCIEFENFINTLE